MDRINGLDGLRGIAILAVMSYHFWPATVSGGFVGVTLFFALSGFLITSILSNELDATGTVSLQRFYGRRVRRLAPPALATLVVVTVGWSAAGWITDSIRRQILVSLGQSANWGQIAAHQRYGTDAATSPVLHFWSLAVEEQMYLVLPIVVLACRSVRRCRVVLAIALCGSVAAIVWSAHSASMAYYSTLTRGGEMLVGALVATVLRNKRWHSRRSAIVSATSATFALTALVVVAFRAEVTDQVFSNGALLGCAVIATIAIASVALVPAVGRCVDATWLAPLGRISYAVYLFHWPMLLALRHSALRPELVPWVAAVSSVMLAIVSNKWMERPIRAGAVHAARLGCVGACVVAVIVVTGAIATPAAATTPNFDAAVVELEQVTRTGDSQASTLLSVRSTIAQYAAEPPVRIGFFGDSKALTLGLGTARAGFRQLVVGASFTALGCPTGRGGSLRMWRGAPVVQLGHDCDWTTGIAGKGRLDVAVVWSGTWDVADRRVPALGNRWTNVDDTAYRSWLLDEMTALTDLIVGSTGAKSVLWLTVPTDPSSPHPARFAAWNTLVDDLQRERPGVVHVVDVAEFVATNSDPSRLLPDGIHPSFGGDDPENSAAELTERLILPLLTNPSARPDAGASDPLRRPHGTQFVSARW